MKLLWPLLVSSLLLAFQPASAAQKPADPWPPVSQEELKLNDVPGYPGSAAMQLYFSYFKDDNEKFIAVHRRIKVLREAGKHYADVAIPVEPGQSLRKLRARTIHPDGTVIEFSGKPFEKIIFIESRCRQVSGEHFHIP